MSIVAWDLLAVQGPAGAGETHTGGATKSKRVRDGPNGKAVVAGIEDRETNPIHRNATQVSSHVDTTPTSQHD